MNTDANDADVKQAEKHLKTLPPEQQTAVRLVMEATAKAAATAAKQVQAGVSPYAPAKPFLDKSRSAL